MKALFVSEAWLQENSIINENVSYAQIRPTLVKVQEMRIQPIVGTDLYRELEGQIVSGTTTALNTTLLNDYLRPAIREWLYFELPNVLAFKYMNKGMVRRRSEESEVMDMEEVKRLIAKAQNDAEWYSERATRYLLQYRTDYPLFNNYSLDIDKIRPQTQNYQVGINLNIPNRFRRPSYSERYQGQNGYCDGC
jgi:hypothetical protein